MDTFFHLFGTVCHCITNTVKTPSPDKRRTWILYVSLQIKLLLFYSGTPEEEKL